MRGCSLAVVLGKRGWAGFSAVAAAEAAGAGSSAFAGAIAAQTRGGRWMAVDLALTPSCGTEEAGTAAAAWTGQLRVVFRETH